MVSAMVALCPLAVLPVTVKLSGFAEVEVSPVTVIVLDWPTGTELWLNSHVTPPLQVSVTGFRSSVFGPCTLIWNCAALAPMVTTVDRELAARVKTELPVPLRVKFVDWFTASDATLIAPVRVPEAVGVKVADTVQLWPTLSVAGTVGCRGP